MILTLLRRVIGIPIALIIEVTSVALTGRECGVGNAVMDRKVGDRTGKLLQTRRQANRETWE